MKGLFIVEDNDYLLNNKTGISKKIYSQIDAFNKAGLNCSFYIQPSGKFNQTKFLDKLKYILPFSNVNPKWAYDKAFDDCDYVYFRRPFFFSCHTLKFLKKLKKNGTKIIIEIPTYPYDDEYKGMTGKMLMLKDRFNRRKLKKYVDIVFYVGDSVVHENIWGIKSFPIINGVNFENLPLRKPADHKSINLLCVSSCDFWHGYERLIEGLAAYYKYSSPKKEDIKILIVGSGNDSEMYENLTKQHSLEEHVVFYGTKYGDELDDIYNISDLSIGSLGMHRKGFYTTSELKSRESFAKGFPFVSGCKVDFLIGKDCPFFLELPNDDTAININSLVDFYHKVYDSQDPVELSKKIRSYAKEYIDINKTMEPVINFIKYKKTTNTGGLL